MPMSKMQNVTNHVEVNEMNSRVLQRQAGIVNE